MHEMQLWLDASGALVLLVFPGHLALGNEAPNRSTDRLLQSLTKDGS
jgi:hypothetical protein